MDTEARPVLFFDGVCNLCNQAVQFVIRQDKKQQFLFAPLQGSAGTAALQQMGEDVQKPGSVVLLYGGQYYTRSTAALRVLQLLGGRWYLFAALRIIPPFLRDSLYNMIATRRYKWFGKSDSCMVPTPALKARFLE